jgi:hypothetical protein
LWHYLQILNSRETIITNCKNGKQKYIKTIGNRYKTSPNTSIRVTERRIANQGGTILSKNIGKAYNKKRSSTPLYIQVSASNT